MARKAGLFSKVACMFLLAGFVFTPLAFAVSPPTMHDYTAIPQFVDQSVKPNILILMDNSGSMNEFAYVGETYDPNKDYYGYFSSHLRYNHDGNKFDIVGTTGGDWCGNFLNFLTMRRVDLMRKVATGGKALGATGGGRQTLGAEYTMHNGEYYYTHVVTYDGDVSPHSGNNVYGVKGETNQSRIYVKQAGTGAVFDNADHEYAPIVVQKDQVHEPDDFYDHGGSWRIGGVLQQFGEDANWGNMWFIEDSKSNTDQGGEIENSVGAGNFTNIITDLRDKPADKWTPLAESYYVAMQHFKNENVDTSLGYKNGASNPQSNHDPFNDSEWCAKNFVLILSDGASTRDAVIPDYLKDYADDESPSFFLDDEDGSGYTNTDGRYPQGGTDFLKDIAYYARANNLRDDIEGHTHIIPYIVLAFESSEDGANQDYYNARELFMETARQGGWRRQINDNIPGLNSDNDLADSDSSKWDLEPDNYFEAQEGGDLEQALRSAILGMLNRAASGTAAAVVTPDGRSEGEGSVIQSYFQPSRLEEEGDREIEWSGYMHSLWIDSCGNLREDTGGNQTLDFANSKIVEYEYHEDTGTLVKRFEPIYNADDGLVCPGYDPDSPIGDPFEMNELESIFEAGEMLWKKSAEDRTIYTYSDTGMIEFKHDNGTVDDNILHYLGVNDASVASDYSLDHLGADTTDRGEKLIDYIRGEDFPGLRNRTIKIDDETHVWKLGNIVSSTPVVIGGAVEHYDLIHSDSSYRAYRQHSDIRNRETMVYVGANDGMLHAFTHGKYDRDNKRFETGSDEIGQELWSYIPRSLLPHLKWLADPDYTHVFYADLQPRIFDAKISTKTSSGWGTYLLLGLNKGGKRIYINKDGEEEIIYPSYTLIDITDPTTPELMWERSYEGTGLTTSIPTVFKVGDEWFAAFGSGPNDDTGKTDYDGMSDQTSTIYIINLKTGELKRSIGLSTENAFLNSPVAFDKNLNYNVDGIYFGESYLDIQGGKETWKGNIHKVEVAVDENFNYNESPASWSYSHLFESPGPVTAGINMRTDPDDNVMLFFGTGRYISREDKQDDNQQYLFGIKDPFYDDDNNSSQVDFGGLFKANPIHVTDQGWVYEGGSFNDTDQGVVLEGANLFIKDAEGGNDGTGTFNEMVAYVRNNYQGWYRELDTFGSYFPSERIVSRPSLIGGTLLVPTFVPVDDVCEPMGESNVLSVYYQSGTGHNKHVLDASQSPGKIIRDGEGQNITAIRFKQTVIGAPAASITHHGTDIGILQLDTAQTFIFEYDPDIQRSRITGWRDR